MEVVTMDWIIAGWQWFDTRSVKWTVGATFSTISSGAIVRMQKHTVFIDGRGDILVANDAWKWLLGLSVRLFPIHAWPTARAKRIWQMLQIFQKLQCLTDTSILIVICPCFIYVLTRNRSNDNPFLAYTRPFHPVYLALLLWWPEALWPCISHITASHDWNL